MEDIQGMWEVPSIAHFCSLFRAAFNLLDFDIEELEEALLLDGVEDLGSPLLQELIVRLLSGCFENDNITTSNYEMYLRRLFRQKHKELGCPVPYEDDSSFQFFPLHVKIVTLQMLCDFRLDAEDVQDVLKNLEADSLRVEPLGYNSAGAAYWYFYGTRLYKEDPDEESSPSVDRKKKGNQRKKKPPSKWQIVCYEEEDWTHLTKKLGTSSSKQEKSLFRILKEDFLPEIPTLFEEKEKQRLKRSQDVVPSRKVATRSGQSENARKSPVFQEGYSTFQSRVKPSTRSSDSNLSDTEERLLDFSRKNKKPRDSTEKVKQDTKKPIYTSDSEPSEQEIIPQPKRRGGLTEPKPVIKTKGAVKQMAESPERKETESEQENRKPVKESRTKKKQSVKKKGSTKAAKAESAKRAKLDEVDAPAQRGRKVGESEERTRKLTKSDFDSDISDDENDKMAKKNLNELDNLVRTKTRPRYQEFYTDSEEEVTSERKTRSRNAKRGQGRSRKERESSRGRTRGSKRRKSKSQESGSEDEVLPQKVESPTPGGRLKGRQTNNSLSTTVDPDILCAAFATLEEDVKTWTDKKKKRAIQKEVKRLQMEMERARNGRRRSEREESPGERSPSVSSSTDDMSPKLLKIVDTLREHEDAYPFLDSVDEEFAPDYYAKIENPMDLQRMKMKVQTGHYDDLDEFVSDFLLIPENCKQYHGSGSEHYEMSKTLETLFEELIRTEFRHFRFPVRRSKTPPRHNKKDRKKSHKKKKKREKHRDTNSVMPERKSRNRSSYKEISDSESDGLDEAEMLPRKSDIYTSSDDNDDRDVKKEVENPYAWLNRKTEDSKASALGVLVGATARANKDPGGDVHWAKKLSQAYQEHARQDKEGYFSDSKVPQEEERESERRSPVSKKPKIKKVERKTERLDRRPPDREKPRYNRNVIPKQPELDNVIMKLKETRTALQQQRRTNDDTSTLNLGTILSEKSEKPAKSPEPVPEPPKSVSPVPLEEKPQVENPAHKATPNLSAWFKAFGNQKALKPEPNPVKQEAKAHEPLNLRSFLPPREEKLLSPFKPKQEDKSLELGIPSSLSYYEMAAKKAREAEKPKTPENRVEPEKVKPETVKPLLDTGKVEVAKVKSPETGVHSATELPKPYPVVSESPKQELRSEPARADTPTRKAELPRDLQRQEYPQVDKQPASADQLPPRADLLPLRTAEPLPGRAEPPKIEPFRTELKSERKIQTAVVSPLQRAEITRVDPIVATPQVTPHPSPSHVQVSNLREMSGGKFSNPSTPLNPSQGYEKLSESQLQDLRNMYATDSPQPRNQHIPDRAQPIPVQRPDNRLEEHLASLRNAYQGTPQSTKQDRLEDHLESLRKMYQSQPVQNPPKPVQVQPPVATPPVQKPEYSNYTSMAQPQAYPPSYDAQKYLEMSALAMRGYTPDLDMATRQHMYQQYSSMMQQAQVQKDRTKEAERQSAVPQYPGRSDVNPYSLDHLNRMASAQNLDLSRNRIPTNKPSSSADVYQGMDPYEAARSAAVMNRAQMGMSALAGLNEMNTLPAGIGQMQQQSSSKGVPQQQVYGNPAFDNSPRYPSFRLPDPSSALYHHYLQQNPDFLLKNPAHSQLLQQSLLNASMNPNMRFPPGNPYQQRWT